MNLSGRYALAWLGWNGTVTRSGYLRLPEWLGVVVFLLCLAGLIVGYETLVAPLSRRINGVSRETGDIRRRTEAARVERQRVEREAAAFADAMENWRRFERERLRDARVGQLALIDEINALARKHEVKLTNTIAFAMTDRDETTSGGAAGRGRGNRDIQSYPAFDVQFGISGPYRNIRRFIHALEQSRQFLLLELLSFTPGETEARPGGKTSPAPFIPSEVGPGEMSINLTLTAYFRNDSPTASAAANAPAPRSVASQPTSR